MLMIWTQIYYSDTSLFAKSRLNLMQLKTLKKIILLIAILYLFIFSIQLMGSSFKLLGTGFAEALIQTTANPVIGLLIGTLATSIIQSS